jgi:hypothetical protein
MAYLPIRAVGGSRDLSNPCRNHHPARPLRRAVRSWLFRQEFADRVCHGAHPDWRDDARERVKKVLLVFRWLDLRGKSAFEVLPDTVGFPMFT